MATRISEALLERARSLMEDQRERDYLDLAQDLGISTQAGLNVSKLLHSRHLVFMCGGHRSASNGVLRPIYRIGSEPDVQMAARVKYQEEGRRYLKSQREWLAELDKNGAHALRNPLDVALFGEYRRAA